MGKKFITAKSRMRFVLWTGFTILGVYLAFCAFVVLTGVMTGNIWEGSTFLAGLAMISLVTAAPAGIIIGVAYSIDWWISRGK